MNKVRTFVARIEHSKVGAQVFRFVRIFGVAVLGSIATGNPLGGAALAAAAETAFRQVFPHGVAELTSSLAAIAPASVTALTVEPKPSA